MSNHHLLELIAFDVAGQEFCAAAAAVREIRGWTPATPLPHNPDYMSGVIEVRGALLSIIDLAARFGFDAVKATPRHIVIVVEVGGQHIGLLADAVSDILKIERSQIQPPPANAPETMRRFVSGLLALDGRMISVLALDKLLERSPCVAA